MKLVLNRPNGNVTMESAFTENGDVTTSLIVSTTATKKIVIHDIQTSCC